MDRYAPPTAEIADIGISSASAGTQLLRNMAALVVGLPIGWLAIMGSRFLVHFTINAVPHFAGRYSIGVAEFLAALLPAVIVGALACLSFTGRWRHVWWWGLSIALLSLALSAVEPVVPDGSSRSLAIMSFWEFSSFLIIGLTASLLRWQFKRRRGAPAA
jgi:hypothetical protein